MPLQATSGAASYDAFGGGVPFEPNYIESVFSTWLYTGNDSTQTITNGIDLAGKGGLVWTKTRNVAQSHQLVDTVRGQASTLISNSTNAATVNSAASSVSSFSSTGYVAGVDFSDSTRTYASWAFRKAPKFFDVVTYTGNGTSQNIPHNLQSVPGFILIKATSTTSDWFVLARYDSSGGNTLYRNLRLNTTAASVLNSIVVDSSVLTSFPTGVFAGAVNTNGVSYVAYFFAHNAGGFGLSGTDNVISCGSFTTDGAGNATVDLGYEPQWILFKGAGFASDWVISDTMRGFDVTGAQKRLFPNTAAAEGNASNLRITNTGFSFTTSGPLTYIYIAIRRGPMKTPTTGTSVFKPLNETGTGSARTVDAGFPVDTFFIKDRTGLSGPTDGGGNVFYDRLRGNSNVLQTQSTAAEAVNATYTALFNSAQNGVVVGDAWSAYGYREYCFRRAPGFFDEVCYTGTNTTTTQTHSLQAVPELIIVKRRNTPTAGWQVYSATYGRNFYAFLDLTQSFQSDPGNAWGTTDPTTTTFGLSALLETNGAGGNYVAYLFASCPGVSKVGSYTGTGTTQTINCGFTGGARFVLIKAASTTGDWLVWDTARGMIPANDPYLRLNSTAAEVTGTDWVDTAATGFELSNAGGNLANSSGVSYIFWAVA